MSTGRVCQTVLINVQPVELYKVLKFEGLVASGAQAKQVIDSGLVSVNSEAETRRRRKIVHGDTIDFEEVRLIIVFDEAPSP